MKSLTIYSLLLPVLLLAGAINVQAQRNGETAPDASQANYNVVLPQNYNQGSNTTPSLFNIIRTWNLAVPVTDSTGFSVTAPGTYRLTSTYTNGWGSPLQSIRRNTNFVKDVVSVYDNRAATQKVSLLSYPVASFSHFQVSPYADQQTYYNGQYPNEGSTAFSVTDNIALNGTQYQYNYAPGLSFAGSARGTKSYAYPEAGEGIVIWNVDNTTGQPISAGTYNAGQLTEKVTEGQHGAVSISYTDKGGQLICTKVYASNSGNADGYNYTYYVYDDLGRLRYVFPPVAVENMRGQSWVVQPDVLDGYCYSYIYNDRGQVISKHTPGKTGTEETVYDIKHRPVLVQTPLLAGQGKWKFTIYDTRGRVAVTGLVTSSNTRTDWEAALANGANPGDLADYLQHELNGNYPAAVDAIPDCRIEEINYYDNYNYTSISGNSFDNSFSADYRTGAEFITPNPTSNTDGLLTGKVIFAEDPGNVLQNSTITAVYYYDRHGKLIQAQEQNPFSRGKFDEHTIQYDFSGNVVLDVNKHFNNIDAGKGIVKIAKRYNYDVNTGRLQSVQQQTDNDGNWITLTSYTYDDLGRINHKRLGNNIEDQYFEYNIRGQQTAMNHGFVDNSNCGQCATMHYGQTLHYDYGVDNHRYDGSIGGFMWRNAGGPGKRIYEYTYDEAGRMNTAYFSEYTSPGLLAGNPYWNTQEHNYSVLGIQYDPNGNMLTMEQEGVYTNGSVYTMDLLSYAYKPNSNQLDNVTDGQSLNFGYGEFSDNGHSGAGDYRYDADGNMTADANKSIDSIRYNYRDQPDSVGGAAGQISYLYAGDGTLLRKTITDNSSNTQTVYQYWGPFVYRNDSLLYVLHEEGRMRWLKDSTKFKYDFFIKDHLGNVRSTVAMDLGGTQNYLATHEIASANLESAEFDALNHDPKPAGSGLDSKATLLDGSQYDRRIGTSILLHVMAGDQFNVSAEDYYDASEGDDNVAADAGSMVSAIIGTLTGGVGGVAGSESHDTHLVSTAFNGDNYSIYDVLKESMTNPSQPRAYLNYIVFDESMHIIPEESGAIQVNANNGSWQQLTLPSDITMQHNGYLAVYVSNEQHRPVYFDNVNLTYYHGRLQEEQHYYPHGLAINMGANTPLPNKYLYQGKELQDQLNLNLYDFGARQYDPQIGRFWGIDPADQFPSGYTGMANDPANNVDPTGMAAIGANGGTGGMGLNNSVVMGGNPVVQDQFIWSNYFDDATNIGVANSEQAMTDGGGGGGGSDDNSGQGTQEPTVVYTSEGQRVANIPDGSSNVLILNEGQDASGIGLLANMDQFLAKGGSATDFTKVISQLGVTYDVKSYEEFFDKFSNAYTAKTAFGYDLSQNPQTLVNGKPLANVKLYAEVSANLVMRNGIVTVGNVFGTKTPPAYEGSPSGRELPNEANKIPGIEIHLHPTAGSAHFDFGVNKPTYNVHGGFPSDGDRGTATEGRIRNILIDSRNIYFYTKYKAIIYPR